MYQLATTIPNEGPPGLIPEVSFRPDGSVFALPYREANTIQLHDARTLEIRRVYANPEAELDEPHAVLMTDNHLIAASRHNLERPGTFNVYRTSEASGAPVFSLQTPLDHLRECHSMDIRGNILVATYCRAMDCIGATLSYHFDHETGEISGPIDSIEQIFYDLGEPKGISYAPDGRQVLVSFAAEKVPQGWEKLDISLFKARNILARDGLRGLIDKFRTGKNPMFEGNPGRSNGIAVFDIDEQGRFSPEPVRTMISQAFCRLENIHINGDTAVVADTINNQLHIFDHSSDPELKHPVHTIAEGLAQPHGVKLSPDKRQLVVTNFGLLSRNQIIHWDHHTEPRSDNVMVFERSPR